MLTKFFGLYQILHIMCYSLSTSWNVSFFWYRLPVRFCWFFYPFPKIYLNMPFSIFEFDVFKNTMTNREKSHTLNLLAITVVWEKKVYFGIARAHYQSKQITNNFTCLFLAIDLIFIRSASHSSCTRDSSLVSSSSCCCLSLEVKG